MKQLFLLTSDTDNNHNDTLNLQLMDGRNVSDDKTGNFKKCLIIDATCGPNKKLEYY